MHHQQVNVQDKEYELNFIKEIYKFKDVYLVKIISRLAKRKLAIKHIIKG